MHHGTTLRVLRPTTIAETGTTIGRDALRLEALDNFADTNPSWLRGVFREPLVKIETFSLQRSLHEWKRRTGRKYTRMTHEVQGIRGYRIAFEQVWNVYLEAITGEVVGKKLKREQVNRE